MKNGRSSGLGVIPELIKYGEKYLNRYLLQLINSWNKMRYKAEKNLM